MFRFCGKINVCEYYQSKENDTYKVNSCAECDEEFCNEAKTNHLSFGLMTVMSFVTFLLPQFFKDCC